MDGLTKGKEMDTKQPRVRLLPVESLLRYLAFRFPGTTDTYKAVALGVSLDAYQKMRRRGFIRWTQGDRYAIHLGRHPVHIWDNWYELTHKEDKVS